MFKFFDCLTKGTTEELEQIVPERDYRKALLLLTKNVTPIGKRFKEVGIYRRRENRIESVYLTDILPSKIRQALPPTEETKQKRGKLSGILRALHLDQNWLELTTPEGKHIRCDTVHDMLDDVVGPMVNHKVVVSGLIRERYRKEKLLIEDIELTAED
jgi:hypothetical protein